MAQYAAMSPVTLTFTVTLDGVTPGGKCRAKDAVLVTAKGPGAEHFDAVVTRFGDLLVIDRRLARSREEKPAAPVAPAPAKAPVKGKGKAAPVAPAPAAPAAPAPDMAAIVAAVMAALGK